MPFSALIVATGRHYSWVGVGGSVEFRMQEKDANPAYPNGLVLATWSLLLTHGVNNWLAGNKSKHSLKAQMRCYSKNDHSTVLQYSL
jgi:hypothetical protein